MGKFKGLLSRKKNPDKMPAKGGKFGNKCGLYAAILHPLILQLLSSDKLPPFISTPPYDELLKTFTDFYQVAGLMWEHIRQLLLKYPHPLDREAIFGPVLRIFIDKVFNSENQIDSLKQDTFPIFQAGTNSNVGQRQDISAINYENAINNYNDNKGKYTSAKEFWMQSGYQTYVETISSRAEKKELTFDELGIVAKCLAISISILHPRSKTPYKTDIKEPFFTVEI